jgi:hypothetical protein
MQRLGFGLPMVECSRNENSFGCWMREFKVNRHQLRAGAMGVVVIVIVFHGSGWVGLTVSV